MKQTYTDEGIVLRKRLLKEGVYSVTILSKNQGKCTFSLYHTKRLTSKRLGHFETAHYIRYTYSRKDEHATMGETELLWGYSNIKQSSQKLAYIYQLFMVLYKLLPEQQIEVRVFDRVEAHLRMVNKANQSDLTQTRMDSFISHILFDLGYIDKKMHDQRHFEPLAFIENMVGKSVSVKM